MLHRTPAAAALRLTGERPGTAAMPSASASASASKRHSAGSRRWPGKRRPASVAVIASDGPLPLRPPPTIWCGCQSSWRRSDDGQSARPREALCRIVQIDKLERRWAQIASPAGFFNSLLGKLITYSRVSEPLPQRLDTVALAMKFVHWVCEEVDQRFAGYSVYPTIQDIIRGPRASKCQKVFVNRNLERH